MVILVYTTLFKSTWSPWEQCLEGERGYREIELMSSIVSADFILSAQVVVKKQDRSISELKRLQKSEKSSGKYRKSSS